MDGSIEPGLAKKQQVLRDSMGRGKYAEFKSVYSNHNYTDACDCIVLILWLENKSHWNTASANEHCIMYVVNTLTIWKMIIKIRNLLYSPKNHMTFTTLNINQENCHRTHIMTT